MRIFLIRAQLPIVLWMWLCFCLLWLSIDSFIPSVSSSSSFSISGLVPPTMTPFQEMTRAMTTTNTMDIVDEQTTSPPPLFTVGMIADIQYAPVEDGYSYTGTPRFYRHSLEVTRHAFQHFEEEKVDLVINLGDIIDGKCQEIPSYGGDIIPEDQDPGHYSLDHVLDAMSPYRHGQVLHTYGNHCLYNLDREALQRRLGIQFKKEPCGDLVGYYDHVVGNIRFVVLDAYDVAIMQRCEISSQKRKEATEILTQKNPNFQDNMNSPKGLEGTERRFVGFNGAVGPIQLEWLRDTLEDARKEKQRVVILSHNPIFPHSSVNVCLIWNYGEVLTLLREYSDVVIASFCGHAHRGGYNRDPEGGIHFRIVEAALENRPEKTYGIVDIYDDRLVVRGFGNCESATYDFSHCTDTTKNTSSSSSSFPPPSEILR